MGRVRRRREPDPLGGVRAQRGQPQPGVLLRSLQHLRPPGRSPSGPGPPELAPQRTSSSSRSAGTTAVEVRARFQNGAIGAPVPLNPWTQTPVVCEAGDNRGQRVHAHQLPLRGSQAPRRRQRDRAAPGRWHPGDLQQHRRRRLPGPAARRPRRRGRQRRSLDQPARAAGRLPHGAQLPGPWESETGESPNPFLDYRLTVRFDGPGGRSLEVPGFFDADGGTGDVGNVWTARFLPPARGTWTAHASMRAGSGVALQRPQLRALRSPPLMDDRSPSRSRGSTPPARASTGSAHSLT